MAKIIHIDEIKSKDKWDESILDNFRLPPHPSKNDVKVQPVSDNPHSDLDDLPTYQIPNWG